MKRLEIEGKEGGGRLDAFLSAEIAGITRSAAQKLLDGGFVTLLGKPVKKNRPVAAGETYLVTLPDPAPADASPQEIPLDVVYEDGDLIVVNKPKGMVVHPAAGHADGTMVNALLHHCRGELSGIGGVLRPGIVHRIDKDTSGLVIAAKNDAAHLSLAKQLKDHTLSRVYEAVVCGNLKNDVGTVDAPVGRHPTDRKRMAVTDRNGKRAVTHYEVLARYPGYTRVRCHLETGRTHQIRVHMAHLGHPVLGDTVYGSKKPFPGLEGQCLHAGRLRFVHPRTGAEMELSCPLPEYFQRVLTKLDARA
ncbi:RluA family pseudouridine synthase [Papillibacter cinnamivorans]|uniref:Pseudouridine synthase n=1 Tax=Papillibacter cinnamivorans DSM 12816 TaxID=1122930 RepID=A0A1W2A609_9FIRM|nr:RluA family pseudouridine synthase [Papillibacter cinnamivorans]SMC55892.1 23S rRNA pseudouridine1911/1915/1917 synthase [Papillibacter cinnamivorans DSM 12816]